jgi:hypothetical protein
MEMAGGQFSPFMEMVVPPSFTTVQPSLTACVIVSYKLCNCVLRLMEMVSKQFSPFMELLVQLRLTACATASYSLCNCVLQLVQLRLTACATASYSLCNCVLRLVQLRLTACATASYGLWKWLASSSLIYGNGFRSGTSENQRLHKKLGNSENRVTYRLR